MTRSFRIFGAILWITLAIGFRTPNLAAIPAIAISSDASQVRVTFNGTLEAANQLPGPWIELSGATSPFTENSTNLHRFYRARETGSSIFSSSTVVTWTLTGPFQTNFNLAYAGTPDGIFPPLRQKPYFDAQFKMGALELPVTMRVRGNSSLQECSFPKLKMKVSKENRAGTPLADAREIKIGTHCDEGGRGNIGRLRDERAAWREALAYETMDVLGFTSPRVRRAIVEYHDTSAPDQTGTTGWQLARHAFIADDIELVADRLGGRALTDDEISALKDHPFDPQIIIDLELFHALLGNWDFSLDPTTGGIWNTEVIELADKQLIPVAGDFDLASWVTAVVRLSTPSEYHPELADVERQALYTIEQIRDHATGVTFEEGRKRFLNHRALIETKINNADIDDDGRTNALRHVLAFFNALVTVNSTKN